MHLTLKSTLFSSGGPCPQTPLQDPWSTYQSLMKSCRLANEWQKPFQLFQKPWTWWTVFSEYPTFFTSLSDDVILKSTEEAPQQKSICDCLSNCQNRSSNFRRFLALVVKAKGPLRRLRGSHKLKMLLEVFKKSVTVPFDLAQCFIPGQHLILKEVYWWMSKHFVLGCFS